ncbi:MAG TPA: aldolase/citrate lyase family protein [Dehalococcoidales bacterium]|nr:aldolase/citrate lyase family protein [Dehalococcoidales bacterium]
MDLKNKLLKQPLLGSFLTIPAPALVEMLGQAGYDFIIIDAEHNAFNLESIENCLRAGTAVNVPCIVRVAELDVRLIEIALDSGAAGIQVPEVETAQQARRVVQLSHFPPIGRRSYMTTTRAAAHGFRPRSLVKETERQLFINIQVETKMGVKNLAAIQATEGIDVIFIGASDLAMDYGYESASDPAMLSLIEKLVLSIVSAGKVAGIYASDFSRISHLQKLGVRYFTTLSTLLIKDALISQVNDFASRVKRGR